MSRILAIAGSASHPSRTYAILEYAIKLLQQEGFDTDIISVRDLPAEDLLKGERRSMSVIACLESSLLKLIIPQEYGGLEATWITTLKIIREFVKVDSSIAHVFSYHHLGVVDKSIVTLSKKGYQNRHFSVHHLSLVCKGLGERAGEGKTVSNNAR